MKQELINRISSCCLLPFSLMMTWIDSLIFPNDADGSFKAYLKTQIMTNGELRNEAWILLLQNAEFEENSPITSAVAVGWLEERTCPTCNQLEVIINALKISPNFPLFVETNVLDLLSLDIITTADKEPSDNCKHILYLEGGTNAEPETTETLIVSRLPIFHLHNFELIQNSNAYYILERFVPAKRNKYGKSRKGGWKRDKLLMNIGSQFHDGWSSQNITVTPIIGHRPNEIPITNPKQIIDFKAENYIALKTPNSRNRIPRRAGINKDDKEDILWNDNSGYRPKQNPVTRIKMRVKVGFVVGGVEKISKPLNYFSIFAMKTTKVSLGLDGTTEKAVLINIVR